MATKVLNKLVNICSEITNLSIDGVNLSNVATKDHTHTMADITDLTFPETDLSNIAEKDHTHEISDVNNLQDSLDSKASSDHNHDNTYAALSHTSLCTISVR